MFSCGKKQSPDVSFYYWKTAFRLSAAEKEILSKNEVSKLYVRYFDVALVDNKPFPIAPVRFVENPKNYRIVPVVFIKNEVFLSRDISLEKLAGHVLQLIRQIDQANTIQNTEIQIDCDWSLNSRDNFMEFLRILKKKYPKTISATIRLHQVKYFKETKVPPVDYGVLMFYNMGKLGDGESNSIYDPAIAKRYLPSLKEYPLKLKVALPVFSWIVHTRNHKIVNLISKIEMEKFSHNLNFEPTGDNVLRVKENTLCEGFFFKEGDQLKAEKITPEDLHEMSRLLKANLSQKPDEIIYYDLDNNNIKRIQDEYFFKANSANF
ncbi:hypothetical protein E4635_12925 [Flavobacterium humi]|uniref:Uncharacterized protein n=1 Tax=Flavobacterium humi TaxID=2562683 RepID=A0A4Z0L7V5_9FLAO|nr:hypothetical protein E4635_12925 [Flavobacterium humi]